MPGSGSEEEFLKHYDASRYDRPNCTVDTVIFAIQNSELRVLINKRPAHPFRDQWALVGGFVDLEKDRDLEDAARRKLFEKTAVKTPYLEQYGTIGNFSRDPRGWSITTVYFALVAAAELETGEVPEAWPVKWAKISGPVRRSWPLTMTLFWPAA